MSTEGSSGYSPQDFRTPDGAPSDIVIFTITSTEKETIKKALLMQMELAFDHNDILRDALEKIREKMLTMTIAREFLPRSLRSASCIR